MTFTYLDILDYSLLLQNDQSASHIPSRGESADIGLVWIIICFKLFYCLHEFITITTDTDLKVFNWIKWVSASHPVARALIYRTVYFGLFI